ncbi:muts domain V-domain-containing protein [Kalaharituber pfeilii]|nr:muts domain V-domain-containing protein [Kalaharituber pfeilii]
MPPDRRPSRISGTAVRDTETVYSKKTTRTSSLPKISTSDVPRSGTTAISRQRPATATSRVGGSQSIICALTESRGVSATVGLSFVNLCTGECVLCEICDTQQYVRTLHKLHVYDPTEILIPNTAFTPIKSKLVCIVEETIPDAKLLQIPRKYYNEQTGHSYIQTLAFKEDAEAIKVAISVKFYTVSALAAALKYIEIGHGVSFASNSLRVKYEASEGCMLIDFSTVHNLELIQNIQHPQSTDSLFGLLNNTLTPMGARLLRSNILQPLTDLNTINSRLDALEELTQTEEMFFSLRSALKPILDMDRLLTALITIPVKATLQLSEQAINNVIILKQALACVGPVSEALVGARCTLLCTIRRLCNVEAIAFVQNLIDEVINEDITWAKSALELRNQRCHAVKSGVNGLLDVARQTFKEATEDVHQLVQELSEEYTLTLDMKYENARGYYLRVASLDIDDKALPAVFINVVERKKMLEFTTLELMKRNAKINDSLTEVLLMSDKTIQTLIDDVRKEIGPIYKLSEGIALLDMIVSFCQLCTVQDYAGRHPLREKIHKARFVPNDVYASVESRFQIITGIYLQLCCNMSGKSTYIRSIALMCVIAQIGSFVPAQFASFPIINQLFARVSMDDGIEANASTFALEMRETAFILHNAGEGSMIIMDELGRGTSTRDGLAIALSVCEALVKSKAFIWFATHFRDLALILGERAGVVNLHMQVEVVNQQKVAMLYKIADGTAEEEHYGLALAKLVDLPPDVLKRATAVSTYLICRRRKVVLALKETLMQAKEGKMDNGTLHSFLAQLQNEFVIQMEKFAGKEAEASRLQEINGHGSDQLDNRETTWEQMAETADETVNLA